MALSASLPNRRRVDAALWTLPWLVLLAPLHLLAATTNTPGVATFNVTTATYGGQYAPRHVLAIWVADTNNNFVKTLEKRAQNRQQYLYRWIAARGGWTNIDGTTSATINSHIAHTAVWDCKTTNGQVAPDGIYRFYVEFTEANAQGPWITNSIPFYKGPLPVTNTPANMSYFRSMSVVYLPAGHDLAMLDLTPSYGFPDSLVSLRVLVTNRSDYTETFTVTLTNLTTATRIGAQVVNALAPRAATNVVIPWDTTGLPLGEYQLQATAGPVPEELLTADNTLIRTVTVRERRHDIGVVAVTPPVVLVTNLTSNVVVTVTNAGDYTESFGVTLTDLSQGRLLGSNWVSNLAPLTNRTLTFSWRGTNVFLGYHLLQALAWPLPGEASFQNNTNTVSAAVALGSETITLFTRGSLWRYHDQGVDLTATPWRESWYYDGAWPSGPAPMGYADPPLNTTLSFGTNAAAKYPTYYFRRRFYLDWLPVSLTGRLRRDDAAVVYFNGVEVYRYNLPAGLVGYTTYALTAVDGTAETNYFEFTVGPTNLVAGENTVAVEIHQASPDSSDLSFDLELLAIRPSFPIVRAVAALEVRPAGDAVAGDQVPVFITVTNQGNVTESLTVYLRDLTTGQILGAQAVSNLVPQTATVVRLDWKTLGAALGPHTLQAFTVAGGVTNLVGVASATGLVRDAGVWPNPVNVLGAVGGRCAAVALSGNLLVVGAGATLQVFDRSDPAAPTLLGQVRLPGVIEDLVVTNAWAYVACGHAGVQVVDLANPGAPTHRNTIHSSGHAYAVSVSGNHLYVADGVAGVRALSLADPAEPVLVGTYPTEGPARAIVTTSVSAFVLDEHKGLQILNITAPTNLTRRGAYEGFDSGQALAVSSTVAYVVDGQGRLHFIYVLTPGSPSLLATRYLGAVGRAVALHGSTVYVALGEQGLLTVNAASLSNPVLVSTNATGGEALDFALASPHLFLANGLAGLQTWDISTPTAPTALGQVTESVRAVDVALVGSLAYVAAGEAGFRIYDVAAPGAPALRGLFTGVSNARAVAVAGSTAYVGDGLGGLKILDVSTPEAPTLRGSYTAPALGWIKHVGVVGALVVVNTGDKVSLLDVTDPATPVWLDTYAPPAFAHGMAVANDRAYLACGEAGLVVLDVSVVGLMPAGGYDTPGFARSVSVSGDTAYVADGPAGWLSLDVADPSALRVLQTTAAHGPVAEVTLSGSLAVLGDGAKAALAVKVSPPLTPVVQQRFGPLIRALRLSAGGGVVAAAEEEAGLALLDPTETDGDHDSLPDLWEQQIAEANPYDALRTAAEVRPEDDFDGDGASNRAEYVAGTSPTDAASVFLAKVAPVPSLGATIRWHSVSGKTYAIYKATDLGAGFVLLQDHVPATPPFNTFVDPSADAAAFYLISVR